MTPVGAPGSVAFAWCAKAADFTAGRGGEFDAESEGFVEDLMGKPAPATEANQQTRLIRRIKTANQFAKEEAQNVSEGVGGGSQETLSLRSCLYGLCAVGGGKPAGPQSQGQ